MLNASNEPGTQSLLGAHFICVEREREKKRRSKPKDIRSKNSLPPFGTGFGRSRRTRVNIFFERFCNLKYGSNKGYHLRPKWSGKKVTY